MLEPNIQKTFLLNDFSTSHLSTILSNIDSPDPMVANTWLETLLDIMKVLPKETVVARILPFAITKGQKSQSLQSKLVSIKILPSICYFLDPDQLLKDLLPLVRSLAQDEELDVRVAICSLFNLIYVKLDSQFLESGYRDLLLELFHDESLIVRDAVFTICSDMVSLCYNEDLMKNIFPKCKNHIETAIEFEPRSLPQASKNLCVFASVNEELPVTSDKMWFVNCYIKIFRLTEENIIHSDGICLASEVPMENDLHDLYLQCRISLSSSFDFMAKLCSSLSCVNLLCPLLESFAKDVYYVVRQRIAEKLGLFAPCFRDKSSLLFDVFNRLLKDSSIEVLKSLVPQFADILQVLNEAKIIGRSLDSKCTEELCRSLIQCESKIFTETLSWQLYENLTEQFTSFPKHFPHSIIYNGFCKLFFERMTQCRALPSRLACTRILLVFLRHNSNPKQCNEIRRQLIDLSYSDNFYERMLFVKTCSTILDLFSSYYFDSYFLPTIFRLAGDKVANIRLAIVFLLSRIMTVVQLNKSSSNSLECVLTKFRNDTDPEIRYQLELLDSTHSEPLLSDLIKENEKKFQEEALMGEKGNTEPPITTSFSVSTEPSKNRWAVLTRSSKAPANSPKLTSSISSNANRFPLVDPEMEFMIDAGVSFSKTVSSQIPTISQKPPSEHYGPAHLFPNCSNIPIISTSISPSYHFSPLILMSSNSNNPHFSEVDSFDHFSNALVRGKHIIPSYFEPDPKFNPAHARNGRSPAEKVMIKSYSSIPKSKVFRISTTTSEPLFNSRDARLNSQKLQPLERTSLAPKLSTAASSKNGSNVFTNNNREVLLGVNSFSSKGRPQMHLRLQSPLISIYRPSVRFASQPQSQSGRHIYSQDLNLNPPRPRLGTPENVNRQKKYNSRLPVRLANRDSQFGSP